MRLLRPVKEGRPGNTTLRLPDGSMANFHSDTSNNGNWTLPGAYHVSDRKLRQICKDVRVFFGNKLTEGNGRPWEVYEMDVEFELTMTLPLFDPNKQHPSMETSYTRSYNQVTAGNSQGRQVEESSQEPEAGASSRTLGDYFPRQDEDREKDKRRGRRQTSREEDKRGKRERQQEERRIQARETARQKAKARNKATEERRAAWEQIRGHANKVKKDVQTANFNLIENVADLNMGSNQHEISNSSEDF